MVVLPGKVLHYHRGSVRHEHAVAIMKAILTLSFIAPYPPQYYVHRSKPCSFLLLSRACLFQELHEGPASSPPLQAAIPSALTENGFARKLTRSARSDSARSQPFSLLAALDGCSCNVGSAVKAFTPHREKAFFMFSGKPHSGHGKLSITAPQRGHTTILPFFYYWFVKLKTCYIL